MRIKEWILLPAMTVALGTCLARPLWAATIEVESDDDEAVSAPTALSSPAVVNMAKPVVSTPTPIPSLPTVAPSAMDKTSEAIALASPMVEVAKKTQKENPVVAKERVRISDRVNFFNFVRAGYMVSDPTQAHGVGTVVKTGVIENYTFGQKPAVDIDKDRYSVKKGDLFIVYRCEKVLEEPHSGILGYQVQNLALVEVIEAQRTRHLVEVKKSFGPFQPGDMVIPYESEVRRWKQAQVKKPLPTHPVLGYVVGLDSPLTNYSATDPVLITAGTEKGVVEGQRFNLFKTREGEFDKEDLGIPVGSARVLYCGQDYSIAVLMHDCSEPIETGFQAVYRP